MKEHYCIISYGHKYVGEHGPLLLEQPLKSSSKEEVCEKINYLKQQHQSELKLGRFYIEDESPNKKISFLQALQRLLSQHNACLDSDSDIGILFTHGEYVTMGYTVGYRDLDDAIKEIENEQ